VAVGWHSCRHQKSHSGAFDPDRGCEMKLHCLEQQLSLLLPFLKLATSAYKDWLYRAIICIDSNVDDLVKGVLTRHHPSEHSVLEFQVGAVVDSDKKPVVGLSA
jgi:hypothetical protein